MLPLNIENGEAITTYNPQRLMRQFGFGQGALVVLGESCLGIWEAEGRYTNTEREALLADWDSIFWPSISREGVLSVGGALYWLRCLKAFDQFTTPNSPDSLLLAPVVLIPARDPYLRVNEEFDGSNLLMEEARRQLKDAPAPEAAPQPRIQSQPQSQPLPQARPQPSQSAESVAPRPAPAAKGKEVAIPSPKNPKKKKRKLTKASVVEPKKKKLMSSAMPSTPIIEVYLARFSLRVNSKSFVL